MSHEDVLNPRPGMPQPWSLLLHEALVQSNQRIIVDCAGDASWCQQVAQALGKNQKTRVLSDQDILSLFTVVPFKKSVQLLGQEFNVIIFDAFSGFDVDTFVRVLGLIKAPGLCLLMRPVNELWLQHQDHKNIWQNKQQGNDYFLRYLLKNLSHSIAVLQCHQKYGLTAIAPLDDSPMTAFHSTSLLSEQQQFAWDKLQTFFHDGEQSLALTAERGRGKSTLLGRWISQKELSEKNFIITSDSKNAAGHCLRFSEELTHVEYVAFDRLLIQKPHADCLIVDEAATIPIALLFELKQHYKKVIYTTTLDGYEGTGQGFELQFLSSFSRQSLNIIELTDPMRWGNNDLLEIWMKNTFLLGAIKKVDNKLIAKSKITYQRLSQYELSHNETLLKQVFHLLKTSHYRTKASDLRMLLDNPDIVIFIAKVDAHVIAVLLLVAEGELDRELTTDIYYGTRRPQGHLLAQGLTVHAGCEGFSELKGYRVQRIAVSKLYRQQGIGSYLIKMGVEHAKHHKAAYLGAVFALDEKTVHFWKSNKMSLMMVSVGQGTSTGKPSITMLLGFNKDVECYKKQCQNDLCLNFSERLLTHYKAMPADQVSSLISLLPFMGANKAKQCDAYINGFKGFEYALSDLRLYVLFLLQTGDCSISKENQSLLIKAVLQYQPGSELVKRFSLSGKKELNQRIKAILK